MGSEMCIRDRSSDYLPSAVVVGVEDSEIPEITIASPADGSTVPPDTDVAVWGLVTDVSGIDWMRVRVRRPGASGFDYWDGETWDSAIVWLDATLGSGDSWTLSGVDMGVSSNYEVHVRARDNAGNTSKTSDYPGSAFVVGVPDASIPEASIAGPADGSIIGIDDDVTVSGFVIDSESGVDWLRARVRRTGAAGIEYWNGSSWDTGIVWLDTTLGSDDSWTLTGVDMDVASSYRVQIRAKDNAGNTAKTSDYLPSDFVVE